MPVEHRAAGVESEDLYVFHARLNRHALLRRSALASGQIRLGSIPVAAQPTATAPHLDSTKGGCRRQVDGTAGLPSAPEIAACAKAVTLGAMSRPRLRLFNHLVSAGV
jgi:hypothetical protein